MRNDHIELAARSLHREIWQRHTELWPGRRELSVVEIVDPEIAARVLGLEFQVHPDLMWFTHPLARLEETAGILDREERRILIADRFPFETRRFTAAHEIGHFLLHESVKETLMHRDRPISGLLRIATNRPWYEREADRFAACFLMPRKRVTAAFEYVFSTRVPFVFDAAAAFELCPYDPDSLSRPYDGSLARALALASASHFRGKRFVPLHQQFQVSISSMAIRIEELGLIRE